MSLTCWVDAHFNFHACCMGNALFISYFSMCHVTLTHLIIYPLKILLISPWHRGFCLQGESVNKVLSCDCVMLLHAVSDSQKT